MAQQNMPAIQWSTAAARLAQTASIFILLSAALFLAAGRLDWWEAWVFLLVYFAIAAGSALWLLYHDPALSAERSRVDPRSKAWDRAIVAVNLLLTIALWVVIGLDAGRYGWSTVPVWARFLACVTLGLSFSLTLWASSVNTFLSGRVRIQQERGHHAITEGPYRFVRHPMYMAMIIYDLSLPLVLGAGWALVVSAAMIGLVILRTALEDRTLQAELPGYDEYTRQTRYRLLPGVW